MTTYFKKYNNYSIQIRQYSLKNILWPICFQMPFIGYHAAHDHNVHCK